MINFGAKKWVLVICLLFVSCSLAFTGIARAEKNVAPKQVTYVQFDLNIPEVAQEMLESSFWANLLENPDQEVMSGAEIKKYARATFKKCEKLVDLHIMKRVFSGAEIKTKITRLSSRPTKTRYLKGLEIPDEYFDTLEKNLNLDNIPNIVMVKYGITVKRTEMRTFPNFDRIFSEPDDYEFDRFVETAVYPVEPVAILHASADKKWLFAQIYNYLAWIPVETVALTDKKTLFSYVDREDFLVVTGKGVFVGYNPLRPEISELQLDMGTKIPLAGKDEIPMEIDGQHPAGNYVIKLPVRNEDGKLEWRLGLISRSDDVRVGYLPYTRRNIFSQAFKFLGQRYGWGGMFNTRDCSAFIMDNFRSMGLILPRNSGEQGKLALAVRHEFTPEMGVEERKKIFDRVPPGSPIYMDGHAMLFLGKFDENYYIIHDFAGLGILDEDGNLHRSKARCVFVTPLLSTFLSSGKKYIEGLYAACEFVLPDSGKF